MTIMCFCLLKLQIQNYIAWNGKYKKKRHFCIKQIQLFFISIKSLILYVCPFFMYHETITYPCITHGIFACMFTSLITTKLSLQCSAYNVPLLDVSPISRTCLNNTMSLTYTCIESAVRVEGTARMTSVPQARMKIIAHS